MNKNKIRIEKINELYQSFFHEVLPAPTVKTSCITYTLRELFNFAIDNGYFSNKNLNDRPYPEDNILEIHSNDPIEQVKLFNDIINELEDIYTKLREVSNLSSALCQTDHHSCACVARPHGLSALLCFSISAQLVLLVL